MTFRKFNSLPGITTSTTIYANDVQLLFGGTPNNLQQLKIYAETFQITMVVRFGNINMENKVKN